MRSRRAAPDGHTLLITTNSTTLGGAGLFKTVPYDPIKDFTPVARIGSFPSLIAVHPDQPIHSMQEFVSYAKANPGKLNLRARQQHRPYHGGGPEAAHRHRRGARRLSQQPGRDDRPDRRPRPAMIPDFGVALPQVKAQKIRPLAVLTRERSTTLPDVPTLHETVLPNYDLLAWAGLFAPASLPPPIAARLSAELEKISPAPT